MWREIVKRCGRRPTRKRVHALRVVTLRMQAEVEHELAELPCASHEAQAMVHFGKLAEKLRDALAPVRELDVWIGKLRSLRESMSETGEYVPRSTHETVRQIEKFENRLTKKRERAALKLSGEIEKRQEDLLSAADELEKAWGGQTHEVDGSQAAMLTRRFAEIVAHFPVFDEGNLHEFRKRIKKVRYLAEVYDADPSCERIAAQMRKAQSAVGEWHDWQILARTAGKGKHVENTEAGELYRSLAAEAYEAAIAVCQSVKHRMADLESNGGIDDVRKPPLRSENAMGFPVRKLG